MGYLTYGDVASLARRKGLVMSHYFDANAQRWVKLRWRDSAPPGCPKAFQDQPLREAFAALKALPEMSMQG